MKTKLELRLLQSPLILLDGVPLTEFPSRKAEALLYYLAVTHRAHTRDALAALLWSESPDRSARTNLRQELSILRRHVGSHLQIERNRVAFDTTRPHHVDAIHFAQEMVRIAEEESLSSVELEKLQETMARYQGDFLEGFYVRDALEFEGWMLAERARFRDLAVQGYHLLTHHYEAREDWPAAINTLRQLLRLEPWQEQAHRQLMLALACSGQRGAALAHFAICQQVLADELDVAPSEETLQLFQQIEAGDYDPKHLIQDLPTQSVTPEPPHNLPNQSSPFMGRTAELTTLAEWLAAPHCRLVIILGAGGMGKTRLAIAAAKRLYPCYRDGVYFVGLTSIERAEEIVLAIANAIGLTLKDSRQSVQNQLSDFLSQRELLLVLDNFEHLLAGGRMVAELVRDTPDVQVVVTSRERLRISMETVFPLQGMIFPDADMADGIVTDGIVADSQAYDAIALFVDSAHRLDRKQTWHGKDWQAIARICRLVEGMPLAIVLAAGWSNVLSPGEIAREIENSSDILESDLRDMPRRQRSMHAVFEQTWQRLSEPERDLYRKLSVFRDGFAGDAAIQVTGATFATLRSLTDKALIRRDGDGRYQIHELLRQYGSEKLAELPDAEAAVHQAHSAYYTQFLVDCNARLLGSQEDEVVQEIGVEMGNVRKAWHWSLDHLEIESIHEIIRVLGIVYQNQSRYLEGANLWREAARRLENEQMTVERSTALANTLTAYGWLCIRLGKLDDAERAFAHARGLYNEPPVLDKPALLANTLRGTMILALARGEYEQATTLGEQVFTLIDRDDYTAITALYGLSSAALGLRNHERAKALAREGLQLAASKGSERLPAYQHNILGQIAIVENDLQTAIQHFEVGYKIGEEWDDPGCMAEHLAYLGVVALLRQEWTEAADLYQRSYDLFQGVGDRGGISRAQLGLGMVAQKTGDLATARTHFQNALAIAVDIQYTPMILSGLAAVGDFLLPNNDDSALGVRVLSFVFHHPACDAQIHNRILDTLERSGFSTDELEPTSDSLEDLLATLQPELVTPPMDHMGM